MAQATVHIVDDDGEFRRALARLLRLSDFMVREYAAAQEFLDAFKDDAPGCILLDLDMPRMNGLQLLTRLQDLDNSLPIIFLSGRGTIPSSVKAIKGGAEDFLCKPVKQKDVLEAIHRAIGRNKKSLEQKAMLQEFRARYGSLSARQKQVYALVTAGRLNKQIANELSTTERTIKAHRQQVMQKLHVRTVAELVSFAARFAAIDKEK